MILNQKMIIYTNQNNENSEKGILYMDDPTIITNKKFKINTLGSEISKGFKMKMEKEY